MEGLIALLCLLISAAALLCLVTIIGHGLWILIASIFSSRKPLPAPNRRARRLRHAITCAGCGVEFPDWEERCPECGLNETERPRGERRDLEAAARTIQRLKEQGKLTAETCEQIYQSIETRQSELIRRASRPRSAEPVGPISQLEAWFGADLGAALTVDEKKQALALARSLQGKRLQELTAGALVGVAQLQTSVGMVSRACRVYEILFNCHPTEEQTRLAVLDALRIACKLEDWPRAQEIVRIASGMPGLIEQQPALAALIDEVRERGAEPAALALVEPEATVPASAIPAASEPPAPLTVIPEAGAAPRRSFAEWIGVFMEERNILWGELIGGTLIIGCSIALVISLWQHLAEIQFFPFLLFAAITGALFGAGFYTLHRWKLESTSRGLLLIASLLVPLTFAVLAGLAHARGGRLAFRPRDRRDYAVRLALLPRDPHPCAGASRHADTKRDLGHPVRPGCRNGANRDSGNVDAAGLARTI